MAKKSDACFQMPASPLRRHSEPYTLHGGLAAYRSSMGGSGSSSGEPRPVVIGPHAPVVGHGHGYRAGVPAPAIPEPDYDGSFPPPPPPIDQPFAAPPLGLRKLSVDSKSELHKEFLWNIKNGVDVLQKKPELQRELERRKEERKRREFEEYQQSKKNTFDLKMERQFRKLELQEQQLASVGGTQPGGSNGAPDSGVMELQRVHSKVRTPAAARSPDAVTAPPSSVPGRLKDLF